VVPVDPACLERAAEIGCQFEVRTLDALHLAAADRLPRPVVMLTFDQRQADAARSMDLVVEGA
jgi:predicted nucleic acid-binding protein